MARSHLTTFSLEELFRTEASALFGFVLLRCGSRSLAEDIASQTFLDASRHDAAGKGHEVSPGWLRTVARRRLIDHWRSLAAHDRRVNAVTDKMRRAPPPDDDPDDSVYETLASLPDRQRAVLVLRYLEEFSVSEIADSLGLTYKATESLLSRARRAFEAAHEEGGDK